MFYIFSEKNPGLILDIAEGKENPQKTKNKQQQEKFFIYWFDATDTHFGCSFHSLMCNSFVVRYY